MKHRSIKKLLLSGFATAALAVSSVASTFAFVILNDEATISQFNFNIQNQEGLWVSLDGNYYSQDISYDMIKSAIEKKINSNNDGNKTLTLDDFIMNPVTPKSSSKLVEISNRVDASGLNSYDLAFSKDKLEKGVDPNGVNDVWYTHSFTDATCTDYISFDLWFRIINNGEVATYDYVNSSTGVTEKVPYTYTLGFTDRTKIEGKNNSIKLSNNLTTYDKLTGKPVLYGPKELKDGEEGYDRTAIEANSADAMRLAVLNTYDYLASKESITETTPGLYVFEANDGLGSAAIEYDEEIYNKYSLDINSHNKDINAMYTYYNTTHPISPFTKAADYNESFNTIKGYTDTTLATFNYQAKESESLVASNYTDVRLTVYLYLEGWDADYLYGNSLNSLAVTLGFEIKQAYDPKKIPTASN